VLAPETFTSSMMTDNIPGNPTFVRFQEFLQRHPSARILFGASTYDRTLSYAAPNPCSYDLGEQGDGRHLWYTAHNTAILTDTTGTYSLYHKGKLVVGVELTPYPAVFIPLENMLGGNLMGKDVGQREISCLDSIGTAICYESVYGEFCTGYVRKGARLLAVITNDAWWGDTPGYRQHLNFSRLRAIETRRWVARCGNTGISAIIDPEGHILARTPWWEEAVLQGSVEQLSGESFFVRYGDMVGRCSVFLFLLLLAGAISSALRPGKVGRS